ncbi:MAG: glycosyltransferase family 2 protein [Candidatus Woesebacteria bacterium]|jgi:GT2 family glycosyltransferase
MSKKKNNIELTLVILNYNSQFWLKKLLSSLKEHYLDQTKREVKTIIVDNNSSDDSVAMLKKEFKWVELIELEENIGFSAGNNVALKKIKSKYLMLLNNDIEFTEKSNLDPLLEFMDNNPKAGIVTPKLLLSNGQLDQACHRGEPTPWASFTYFIKLEKLFPKKKIFGQYHQSYKDFDKPHLIDACSGAAMLVRTSAMKKVGLLDERFFMYAEDLDWCKRFREMGFSIVYLPQVQIMHHKYKSGIKSESDRTSQKVRAHFYNTMMDYYDKHHRHNYPRIYRWLLRVFLFIKRGGW